MRIVTRILIGWCCLVGAMGVTETAFAQANSVICPGVGQPLLSRGYSQLTITSTVVSTLTVPSGSQMAVVEIETNQVRYRDDGTNPSTTGGTPIAAGGSMTICGLSILNNWKVTGVTGNATLNVTFYGRP